MRWFSRWMLTVSEALFLLAHGWKSMGNDWWEHPVDYDTKRNGGEPYRGGHAVNSQKWTNSRDRRAREFQESAQ